MPTPKLLDQVRNVARMRHLSLSTERAYVGWIRRFILFHNKKHPKEMAEKEIRQFISDLAVNTKISASTQTVFPAFENGHGINVPDSLTKSFDALRPKLRDVTAWANGPG